MKKLKKGLNFIKGMVKPSTKEERSIYIKAFALMSAALFLLTTCSTVFHATYQINVGGVEDAFKNLVNSVYGIIIGGSTLIACCIVAINIVTIMTTKNQRKVEQAITWIKAVVFAWFCLNLMSLIIYGIQGMAQYRLALRGSDEFTPLFKYD